MAVAMVLVVDQTDIGKSIALMMASSFSGSPNQPPWL